MYTSVHVQSVHVCTCVYFCVDLLVVLTDTLDTEVHSNTELWVEGL